MLTRRVKALKGCTEPFLRRGFCEVVLLLQCRHHGPHFSVAKAEAAQAS